MPEPSTIVAALLIAIVPSIVYLAVLNAIDRYEKEPWTILLACLGLGAVVAPILVVLILVLLGRPAALPPAFAPGLRPDPVVGIVEEVVKGLLLLGLVRSVRDEFDDVLDGVIYGAALGAGFGAAESFLYVVGGTDQLGGDTVALLVVAGLNNAFYTAVFGATLGYAQRLPRAQRIVITVLGLATAALLHAFHDTLPAILARLLDQPDAALGTASRLAGGGDQLAGDPHARGDRGLRLAARGAHPPHGAARRGRDPASSARRTTPPSRRSAGVCDASSRSSGRPACAR